jgi:hypothetical protein
MVSKFPNDIIKLNVGGFKYETTLNTITSDSDSMLANMFSGRHLMKPDSEGYYFIDRDGDIFKYVVKYLRDKRLNLDTIDTSIVKNIRDEAGYFQINGLVEVCDQNILYKSKTLNINIPYDIPSADSIDEFESAFDKTFNLYRLMSYPSKYSLTLPYSHRKREYITYDYDKDYFLEKQYYTLNDSSYDQYYIYYDSGKPDLTHKYFDRFPQYVRVYKFITDWMYHLVYFMTFDKSKIDTLFTRLCKDNNKLTVSIKHDEFILLKQKLGIQFWFSLELNLYLNDQQKT